MMRGSIIGVILFAGLVIAEAKPKVEWLEREYDLGIIEENGGEVTGLFRFVNKSSYPVSIVDVRPGCGCTAVEYPQTQVNIGDTASINFVFNPKGRPGKINKPIKVYFDKSDGAERLSISGTVAASPETLALRYPYSYGRLLVDNINLLGGELPSGAKRHLFVSVYNNSEDTVSPELINNNKFLETHLSPQNIAPKESATITLYLNTSKTEDTGYHDYSIGLIPSETSSDTIKINLGVSILPRQKN